MHLLLVRMGYWPGLCISMVGAALWSATFQRLHDHSRSGCRDLSGSSDPHVFGVLQSLAFKKGASKWVCLDTPELYEVAKHHTERTSLVLGLATKPELADIRGKRSKGVFKHTMGVGSFLRFVARTNHSTCSIGWRAKYQCS